MAPNMKKETQQRELLITGLACRLPESPSTQSFWENLVAGVDMISKNDEHWEQGRNSTMKLMPFLTLIALEIIRVLALETLGKELWPVAYLKWKLRLFLYSSLCTN